MPHLVKPHFPLRVFYDGGCVVCATEIEHYVARDRLDRLVPIDISNPRFDPVPYHISRDQFMHELHALDSRDKVYRGVEAFWAIWQAFPTNSVYGLLGKLINLPVINRLAQIAYQGFARIRKYLPKRSNACMNGVCRTHERKEKS